MQTLYDRMPRLQQSPHKPTSQPDDSYNCVAWVTRDQARWWQPGFYWPPGVAVPETEDDDLDCYLALFESLGYERCAGPEYEPGYLKIAIYAVGSTFHHVAKQLPSQRWSSKVGFSYDVRHDELDALYDAVFFDRATATAFMKRADDGTDPFEVEEHGIVFPPGVDLGGSCLK